jgi:hypothetical protein
VVRLRRRRNPRKAHMPPHNSLERSRHTAAAPLGSVPLDAQRVTVYNRPRAVRMASGQG